jgi:predicted nucleotidyltransferase
MIDVKKAIVTLANRDVEFVIIGGVALSLHSAAYVTYDIDVCYSRSRENLNRIVRALTPFHPRLRGFPSELPFVWDASTLANGTLFTLATDLGDLDLLGEVDGLGSYDDVLKFSTEWDIYGYKIRVLSVDGLIAAKERAGREKDVAGLQVLYALRDAERDDE